MGLFNKGNKKVTIEVGIDFSKESVKRDIVSMGTRLYHHSKEEGSQILVSYLHKSLNYEILCLADSKDHDQESYAYRRGRIDAIKELIERRQGFISQEEHAKSIGKETDHKAKSKFYSRPRPSTAGLSI